MVFDSYEIKRRWYSFWKDFKDNGWYRNRLIAHFVLAMTVASDLSYFIFGWSKTGIGSAILLGAVYFKLYRRGFNFFNGSILLMPKFGINSIEQHLLMPSLTMALSSIIKLACLKLRGPWWLWLLLWIGISELGQLIRALKIALPLLATHEYHCHSARTHLVSAAGCINPAKLAFDIMHEWVKDATGEDIDLSGVDIHKKPSE